MTFRAIVDWNRIWNKHGSNFRASGVHKKQIMNKSTKIILIVIGTLSIVAGIARFFQGDKIDALLAFVLGISLIVLIYFQKEKR